LGVLVMVDNLGVRIKMLRDTMRLTQGQLAEKVGVTLSTISSYEPTDSRPSRARPSLEVLIKLAQVFGVSTDYLLGVTDDPTETRLRENEERMEELAGLLADAGRMTPENLRALRTLIKTMTNPKQ
jgi:transcriptional regulator with XRE-family HTH domain